ncbi:MAG: Mur ligase domain-containing protein [Chitinispirillales bacterium]|jgi:UDP-N-acetylmuramate--alanine ligase|nr:Mur ligase domain-containing protein [Chitinispirillales bacterium]
MSMSKQVQKTHFVGIFGSGMSAIAQYLAGTGVSVTGSDRLLDSPDTAKIKEALLSCGCTIHPQDGSGVTTNTGRVCVSTAIEESNPDIAAARALNIPILHRSDLLASIVKNKKSIAVAGTSGKSTVTAMIFELLTGCGMSPSLISGAALRSLEQRGLFGNAFCGTSDLLVVEADESDGTLVKYEPYASVILNLSKDHKPEDEVLEMFRRLIAQSTWSTINADDPKLHALTDSAAASFGFGGAASFKGAITGTTPLSTTVTVDGAAMTLPLPGAHNASNLLAALCVCKHLGCGDQKLSEAVSSYMGVDRRFAVTRTAKGVAVIDDFAHNPEKIRAAVSAAKQLSDRIIAIYQPHGFGPTRFLKNEYAATFKDVFRPTDTLCLLPIYYAGGTAVKDIESKDIIELMGGVPFKAIAVNGRDDVINIINESVSIHPDSAVLLMGARDPSLSGFAKRIVESLGGA